MLCPLAPATMLDRNRLKSMVFVYSTECAVFVSNGMRLVWMGIPEHNLVSRVAADHAFIPHIEAMLGNFGMRGNAIGLPCGSCWRHLWRL